MQSEDDSRFQWFWDTYNASEEEVFKYAGHDVLVYLIYLKYSMYLFWGIFLLNGLPLICMYFNLAYERE